MQKAAEEALELQTSEEVNAYVDKLLEKVYNG